MGGSSGNPASAQQQQGQAAPVVPSQGMRMQNFPDMPEQQNDIARQMASGYGGSMGDYQAYLANLYRPAQLPIITQPSDISAYLEQLKMAGKPQGQPNTEQQVIYDSKGGAHMVDSQGYPTNGGRDR